MMRNSVCAIGKISCGIDVAYIDGINAATTKLIAIMTREMAP